MKRRDFLLAAPVAITTSANAAEPRAPIVLGSVSLSFYSVVGAIVAAVLERMGQRVRMVEGTHEEIFPLLGAGDIDLLAAAWLPEGHAAYWQRFGQDAVEVTTLYEDARFFWGVPAYVPANEVASIGDLARPAVASRMTRTIQGIGAGAAISTLSRQVLDTYGLAAQGYSFQPGTQAQWIASWREAVAAKRWLVFPTWAPQFLNRDGELRALQDPRGALGHANRAVLVAPRARFGSLPAPVRGALSRIRLDLDAVTQMDWEVNVGNRSPREAALAFLAAHEARVATWLGSA